ncbi:MAG: response regulator transcription factor [Elusimicrobia bacterium]|nr:response regulator transcription factor [Elusimicrobiota bacterium]
MRGQPLALVEAEPKAAAALSRLLEDKGYEVSRYETPGRLFDALLKRLPRVVLLGLPLPGMAGTDVLRVLRGNVETRRLCVVVLDSEGRPARAVDGLEAGADEYLSKPVDPELLVVRLASLLARTPVPEPERRWTRFGDLALDVDGHACRVKDRDVRLTPIEFEILRQFLQLENRVLTRSQLMQSVWQGDPSVGPRTIDKHVEALRRKLGAFGGSVDTVFGLGYRLRAA